MPDVTGDEHDTSTLMTQSVNKIRNYLKACKCEEDFQVVKNYFVLNRAYLLVKMTRIRSWTWLKEGGVHRPMGWQLLSDYDMY